MKPLKIAVILLVLYVGVVGAFESLIGFFQPAGETTLVITTRDAEGGPPSDRVLARLESGGQLFVAANHWPRAWYRSALANPEVEVTQGGERASYRAVPATAEERARLERLERDRGLGFVFRLLTGFPPRRFLRLDPVSAGG